MKNQNNPPDIPIQYVNLAQLVGTLGQTIIASEHQDMSQEGKERLQGLFDVVVAGLATFIDREFYEKTNDNVLSLVQPELVPVYASAEQTIEWSEPIDPTNFNVSVAPETPDAS